MYSKPLNPNFDEKNPAYAMPFLLSFIGSGVGLGDDGFCVEILGWPNGYCIYPFDLTADNSANELHWCPQEQGNLRMEVGFKNQLTEAVTVIIYAEFREVLEIDKNRDVSIEYSK